jgi:hypothetical protein
MRQAPFMWYAKHCSAVVGWPPPRQYSTQFVVAAIFLTAMHKTSMAVGLGLLPTSKP